MLVIAVIIVGIGIRFYFTEPQQKDRESAISDSPPPKVTPKLEAPQEEEEEEEFTIVFKKKKEVDAGFTEPPSRIDSENIVSE